MGDDLANHWEDDRHAAGSKFVELETTHLLENIIDVGKGSVLRAAVSLLGLQKLL